MKWRFHMQMHRWGGSGTLPNSSDPRSGAAPALRMGQGRTKTRRSLLGGRTQLWIKAGINHVEALDKGESPAENARSHVL